MAEVEQSVSLTPPPRGTPPPLDKTDSEVVAAMNDDSSTVPIAVEEEKPVESTEPTLTPPRRPSPAPSPAPIAIEEPQEDPAEVQRKRDALKQESRKRGNRMFGMMLGTLKRAKQQVENVSETDGMKKRLELERKLQGKLNEEKKKLEERTERERELRDLKAGVQRLEEEISSTDAIYRVRHDAKYNLAGYLCTSFPLPTPASTTDSISVPFTPRLPHSMHLTSKDPSSSRPIYYLPYRLLPSQEDRIEDQIAHVKKATLRDRDEWRDVKEGKVKELRKLRGELEDKLEGLSRLEREERQRKRREKEEREETDRRDRDKRRKTSTGATEEREKEDTKMDEAETTPTTTITTKEDQLENGTSEPPVAATEEQEATMTMEEKENGANEESTEPKEQEQPVQDDEAGKVDEKMDVAGEEDLEY
ncbi:uncharacterized protein JCM6883_002576 [Sporobolomyces salmoneus]|uniref:uncharacterized protein n=1 Tax=Sporobolomyces salmoneus TaxID=183962 RepID=UPI0031755765